MEQAKAGILNQSVFAGGLAPATAAAAMVALAVVSTRHPAGAAGAGVRYFVLGRLIGRKRVGGAGVSRGSIRHVGVGALVLLGACFRGGLGANTSAASRGVLDGVWA